MILNVQSPASIQPVPGATAYCSGRWALRGLTEALSADTFGTGVRVQEVHLGDVHNSAYFEDDPKSKTRFPWIVPLLIVPAVTTESSASAILAALRSGRRRYFYPFMLSATNVLQAICPMAVRFLTLATGARMAPSLEAQK